MANIRFIGGANSAASGAPPQATGSGGGTLTFTDDTDKGQWVGGYADGAGTATVKVAAAALGASAFGSVKAASSSTAEIYASASGSFAQGYVYGAGGAEGRLYAKGVGSTALGYVWNNNPTVYPAYPYVGATAQAPGSFFAGYVKFNSASGKTYGAIYNDDKGAWLGGYAAAINATSYAGPYMRSSGKGGFVFGFVKTGAHAYYTQLSGYSDGAVTFGYVASAAGGSSQVINQGRGSLMMIDAVNTYSTIKSGSRGCLAVGQALNSYDIEIGTNNFGCAVFGQAAGGHIKTNNSLTNAFQFGEGTATESDVVQFGGSIRIKQTDGVTASVANGDIWRANNYVYVRSNGVSVKIT